MRFDTKLQSEGQATRGRCLEHIAASIVDEVREKVRRLKLPKGQSVRTGLIYCGELAPEIDGRDDFDFLVPAEKLLTRK